MNDLSLPDSEIMPYGVLGTLGALGALGAAAFWKFSEMNAAEAKAKEQKRMQEFRAMLGLALELRSCRTLLTLAAPLPETLKLIEFPDSVLLPAPRISD